MTPLNRIKIFLPLFVLLSARSAYADQPLSCTVHANDIPTIRWMAYAERVGDVLLECTGGTPTPSGVAIPQVDFYLSLSLPMSSRILANVFSEALLIVDEPHSPINPSTPLLVCGATGTSDNGQGVCTFNGTGTGVGTYSGINGRANVFQGRTGEREMKWTIPFDPPGPLLARTLRFTNIRVHTATDQYPSTITAVIGTILPTQYRPPVVAFVSPDTNGASVSPRADLSQCSPANPNIANDTSKPLESGGQNGPQLSITFREPSTAVWKVKNISWQGSNSVTAVSATTPADAAQDIVHGFYNTESGFEINGVNPPASLPSYSLPASPAFPSFRQLDQTGKADSGTRFRVRFSGVPAGVDLVVPIAVQIFNSLSPATPTGLAVLVATDANGAGPYARVAGNAYGLAKLTAPGGTANAVYEVVYTSASDDTADTMTISVAAAFLPLSQSNDLTISVDASLAPVSIITNNDPTLPIPRFLTYPGPRAAFILRSCGLVDLTVEAAQLTNLSQGDAGKIFQLTVRNIGSGASRGTVTVSESLANGATPTAISGQGWNCTLSPLSCTRADVLSANSSYPPITITINVAANAPGSVAHTATVAGGGDSNAGNNTLNGTLSITSRAVLINTSPAGLSFILDGVSYTKPQTVSWTPGTIHTISVTEIQPSTPGTRYVFSVWSDGLPPTHTITAGSLPDTYTATFGTQYLLETKAQPLAGGSVSPLSGNYYAAGTSVPLAALPATGYGFGGWAGPVVLPGAASTSVIMSGPQSVTAIFNTALVSQTITFAPIATHSLGDPPFQLVASASSGLPVSFQVVSGPATIFGNLVTLTGTGTVAIRASQSGDAHYAAATPVLNAFTVIASTRMALNLSVNPSAGGVLSAFPAPVDGGYLPGTVVQVTATANVGYFFTGFSGDLVGTSNPQQIVMSANRTVTANFIQPSSKPEDQLTFAMRSGGQAPAAQLVPVDAPSGSTTVSVSTAAGGNWIGWNFTGLNPSSRKVNGAVVPYLSISINAPVAANLPSGSYLGYVVINSPAGSRVISVSLLIDVVKLSKVVNAAGYSSGIAPGGFYTAFGANLASSEQSAANPVASMSGTSVQITDSSNVTRTAALSFVSPGQVNFIAPESMAAGEAIVILTAGSRSASIPVTISRVAPGLFTADATGKGAPAANILTVAGDGTISASSAAVCTQGTCSPLPIDLGAETDSVYLSFYGTGIRERATLSDVVITIGDVPVTPSYAGAQGEYPGLDQINVLLPRSLKGRGQVDVKITVEGKAANPVILAIK